MTRLAPTLAIVLLALCVSAATATSVTNDSELFGVLFKKSKDWNGTYRRLPVNKIECEAINHYAPSERCDFVRMSCLDQEDSPGVLPYLEFYYCTLSESTQPAGILLLLLHLGFLFVFFGTAASDYFCPNLSTLSDALNLPQDVAGVTFLAFGNSAPDVFSTLVAIHRSDAIGMGLGELIGSGLFVGGAVIGVIALASRKNGVYEPVIVDRSVFLRDLLFLIAAVVILGLMLVDRKMYWWQGLIMVLLYTLYVLITIYMGYKARDKKQLATGQGLIEAALPADKMVRSRSVCSSHTDGGAPFEQRRRMRLSTRSYDNSKQTRASDSNVASNVLRHRLRETLERQRCNSINSAAEFMDAYEKQRTSGSEATDDVNTPMIIESEETTQLMLHSPAPLDNHLPKISIFKTCVKHLFPVFWTWRIHGIGGKIIAALNMPATFFMGLTVPVVSCEADSHIADDCCPCDEDAVQIDTGSISSLDGDNEVPKQRAFLTESDPLLCHHIPPEIEWSLRWILVFQMLLAPFFVAFVAGFLTDTFLGLPGWTWSLFLGIILSTIAFFVTHPRIHHRRCQHRFLESLDNPTVLFRHPFVAFIGFVIGIFWIYFIANEVVGLLKALGKIFDIAEAILGITVFAFGNSIGDLVANTTLARMGYSKMSMSASFAGPLLNLLITLGVSGLMGIGRAPQVFPLNTNMLLCIAGLLMMLLVDLVAVPLNGFRVGRSYGVFKLVLYVVIIGVTVALDLAGLELPGLDPNDG